MRGTFIAVIGPSGAGKDTVINTALRNRPDIAVARRIIAPPRPAIGEAADMIGEELFDHYRDTGGLVLSWHAHGYRYGISGLIEQHLIAGTHIIGNLSRSIVSEAREKFDPFLVIQIVATPDVLARRLRNRGRETVEEIEQRLARMEVNIPGDLPLVTIDNSHTLEHAVRAFTRALPPPQVESG